MKEELKPVLESLCQADAYAELLRHLELMPLKRRADLDHEEEEWFQNNFTGCYVAITLNQQNQPIKRYAHSISKKHGGSKAMVAVYDAPRGYHVFYREKNTTMYYFTVGGNNRNGAEMMEFESRNPTAGKGA